MKYVALLRGINVGGNNKISMAELKKLFEENGFENVATYINSGNVLFESDEKDSDKLGLKLEALLTKKFTYKIRVLVKSVDQIRQIVKNVPKEWNTRDDIRCYVTFVINPLTPDKAALEIEIKEEVDSIAKGPGVIYMTSLLSSLTKSKFNKLASKKIYQQMTIRNYNTTKKLLSLME